MERSRRTDTSVRRDSAICRCNSLANLAVRFALSKICRGYLLYREWVRPKLIAVSPQSKSRVRLPLMQGAASCRRHVSEAKAGWICEANSEGIKIYKSHPVSCPRPE